MIHFKVMNQNDIKPTDLLHFTRHQITNRMYYVNYRENLSYQSYDFHQKDTHFIDDWDHERLVEIATYLKTCDGTVVYVYDGDMVIGFSNIEHKQYGDYLVMPYIHISKEYRHRGLGRTLFTTICKIAKDKKAKKLYISAHPSIETTNFYLAMGCRLADPIIKDKYDLEPYDLQLEKDLDDL